MATGDEALDLLNQIARHARGSMRQNGLTAERIGREPDHYGFVPLVLTHGMTKQLFALTGGADEGSDR